MATRSNEIVPNQYVEAPHKLLFTTKLSAPRLRQSMVSRPHLVELISAMDVPLTLVCAPPGYGKSTLVAEWIARSGIPACWVSLDMYDNDPWRFFSLIVNAIKTIDTDVATETSALLDVPLRAVVPSRHISEGSEQVTRPFALVFDDFHVITDRAIQDALILLISNLPRTVRVIITTRNESTSPGATSRSAGRCRTS